MASYGQRDGGIGQRYALARSDSVESNESTHADAC